MADNKDILGSVFPLDGVEPSIQDDLRMGYEDFSENGEATAIFEALPVGVVQSIHRFALEGPFDVIGLVAHVGGLVQGLDERDPERKAAEAIEEAAAEIELSRTLIEALRDNPRLPFFGRVRARDASPDTAQLGWVVLPTTEQITDANIYTPTVDIMAAYLHDPEANRGEYERLTLAFMNDVIFRPGVTFER